MRLVNFEVSPDGRSLAVAGVLIGTDPAVRVLSVMPVGGVAHELVRAIAPEQLFLQAWMPNNHEVLFTKRDLRTSSSHELWTVDAAGGEPRDTGVRIPGFTQANPVQVHPDGTRIAYTASEASWDLWVMEHFLPEWRR
jgi:hypothetical protein